MKSTRILAAGLILASCSSTTPASHVDIALFDGHIRTSSSSFEPGPVSLVATNEGEFAHTVVVTDASGEVLVATDLIPPRSTVELAVDLAAGTYQITCRIVTVGSDGTLFDHYEMGMVAAVSG